jgi:two-component system, NtrC family, nitrogen regulation sensor histidine kinase GlnL
MPVAANARPRRAICRCATAAICYDFAILEPVLMKAVTYREAPAEISWEQILGNLDDGVITADPSGTIKFFNEASEVLTQISSAAATGHTLEQIFKREPWLLALVNKTWPPHRESARGEGDFVTRWGGKIPVSVTASSLQDHDGIFSGTILLLRDLRHQRELEEDLKRADRLATLGTLAAGLAHEIKNPLGGIKGAAQLLRRSAERDPSVRDYTDIMIREVNRVNHLIEQLLDLSRPAQLDLEALNIHEILEDVLLLEGQSEAAQNCGVRKNFDPSLPLIRGDRGRLTQVFLNLVKNAFQAMERPGTLTVTTRVETDFHIRGGGSDRNRIIWVDIADEGGGIRDEDLPHIFSPFFTTKTNGTGLGLATCYQIVKEHGGLIRVESSPNKGSVFRISLLVAN